MALNSLEKTKIVTLLCYPAKILDSTSTTYNKILVDRLNNLSGEAEGIIRDYLDRLEDLDQKLDLKLCQAGLKSVGDIEFTDSVFSLLRGERRRVLRELANVVDLPYLCGGSMIGVCN